MILEPLMKKIKVVKFSDYSDFVNAVKSDPKIEVLSETNNMYRSVLSTLLILCLVAVGQSIFQNFTSSAPLMKYALLPALVVLFGLSYKKQTDYIVKRIEVNKRNSE